MAPPLAVVRRIGRSQRIARGLMRKLIRRGFEAIAVFPRCEVINPSPASRRQRLRRADRFAADRIYGHLWHFCRPRVLLVVTTPVMGAMTAMIAKFNQPTCTAAVAVAAAMSGKAAAQ